MWCLVAAHKAAQAPLLHTISPDPIEVTVAGQRDPSSNITDRLLPVIKSLLTILSVSARCVQTHGGQTFL